jgi:predicted metal-binding protein
MLFLQIHPRYVISKFFVLLIGKAVLLLAAFSCCLHGALWSRHPRCLVGCFCLVFIALRSGMGWSYLLTRVSFTVAGHHLFRLIAITCLCLSVAGSTFIALQSGMGWSYLLTRVSFTVAGHHLFHLIAITCLCLSVAGSTFIVLGDFNFSFCSRCAPFN